MKNTNLTLLIAACLLLANVSFSQAWLKHFGKGTAQKSFLLNDGNLLLWAKEPTNVWVPESFFLKISPDGNLIEKIEFPGRGFSTIRQNADGSFDALGTLPLAAAEHSPHRFQLSPGFQLLTETHLGLDSIEVDPGVPMSTRRIMSGLFHENEDVSLLLEVNFPGGNTSLARLDNDGVVSILSTNALLSALQGTLLEDDLGNYIHIVRGAVNAVSKRDAGWNLLWNNSNTSFDVSAVPLTDGKVCITSGNVGFTSVLIVNHDGSVMAQNPSVYPGQDFGGTLSSAGEIILTGSMVDTALSVFGRHLRAFDLNGNNLWNYWLTFDEVKFRTVEELSDGSYLVFGNEQISISGQPVTNGDLVAAGTLPGGQLYQGQIQGIARVEPDADCAVVLSNPKFPNFKIIADGAAEYGAVTSTNGSFILPTDFDDYTVSLVTPSPFWEVCENGVPVTLNAANPMAHLPFLVHANEDCPYPEVSLGSFRLRRCVSNLYHFSVRNFGSDTLDGAELLLALDSLMTFDSSSWNVASQNGNEVRLSVPVIPPFGLATGYFRFELSCNAELGQEHCIAASLQLLPACLNAYLPFENTECRENTGSYDPNDVTAFADGKFTDDKVYKDQSLEYLIRFQNTGTDTAFRVVIEDLLPVELDLLSFQAGASSHTYETRLEGRLLKFIFNNILLPDSTADLDASQGFVKFKINLRDDLPLGTTIPNKANIFFDFNAPVATNEVVLTLSEPLGSRVVFSPGELTVYPNPFAASFSLQLPETGDNCLVEIQNFTGQMMYSQAVPPGQVSIGDLHLVPGFYQIRVLQGGELVGYAKVVAR